MKTKTRKVSIRFSIDYKRFTRFQAKHYLPSHLDPLNAPGGVLRRHEDVVLIAQDCDRVDDVGRHVDDVARGDGFGLAADGRARSARQDDGELLVGV